MKWDRMKWLVFIAVFFIGLVTWQPYDDSDPPGGRSGLRIYRDALTGCEYLSGGITGALTPRMDRSGRQVCRPAR